MRVLVELMVWKMIKVLALHNKSHGATLYSRVVLIAYGIALVTVYKAW